MTATDSTATALEVVEQPTPGDWGSWGEQAWSDLDARLDLGPRQRWTFTEPGQTLRMVVEAVAWSSSDYGPVPYLEGTTVPDGAPVSLMAGRTALRRQLARYRVGPRDGVAIRYLGEVTPEGGNTYHDYAVAVLEPRPTRAAGDVVFTENPPPDWDLDAEVAPDPAPVSNDPSTVPF